MKTPTLIFLNGTSSAGKTSIAQSLQKVMDEPYLYFSADVFRPMLPPFKEGMGWVVDDILDRMCLGFYGSLAAMLEAGSYVVADQAIVWPKLLGCCAHTLADHHAFFVGVHCPFEVATQRERDRKDRTLGLVKEQFNRVHQSGIYDVEVDSSLQTSEESAVQIARFVGNYQPHAFKLLRQQTQHTT